MTAFWAAVGNFLTSLIRVPLTHLIAFFVGKSAGRKDAEAEQNRNSLDAIADAEDARRKLKHDDSSVHNDPFNRDNV